MKKKMKETALITGSGNGVGEALALVFAENNYNIILHARKQTELDNLSKKISEKGVYCYSVQGDLREDKTIEKLSDIAKEKDITILINNAATRCPGVPFEQITDKYVKDLVRVSLYVPIQLTKMIYPLFQAKKSGTIVNINSITAIEPKKSRTVSSAAKWGLRGFTDCLRLEAIEHNIHVIGVYPTRIKTKPEHEYGMNSYEIATRIYEACKNPSIENIIFEGRPKEFRANDETKYIPIELRNEQ